MKPRFREHGLHEKLLALVNRQLQAKGLILKTCTLVDAPLLQAARRAPAKSDRAAGDGDARLHRETGPAALWFQGARRGGRNAHADPAGDVDGGQRA